MKNIFADPLNNVFKEDGVNKKRQGSEDINEYQNKKRFVWPEYLHKQFISAVFDVGLRFATVKDLNESIPSDSCPTVIQSRSFIQKLRAFRQKSDCSVPALECGTSYGKIIKEPSCSFDTYTANQSHGLNIQNDNMWGSNHSIDDSYKIQKQSSTSTATEAVTDANVDRELVESLVAEIATIGSTISKHNDTVRDMQNWILRQTRIFSQLVDTLSEIDSAAARRFSTDPSYLKYSHGHSSLHGDQLKSRHSSASQLYTSPRSSSSNLQSIGQHNGEVNHNSILSNNLDPISPRHTTGSDNGNNLSTGLFDIQLRKSSSHESLLSSYEGVTTDQIIYSMKTAVTSPLLLSSSMSAVDRYDSVNNGVNSSSQQSDNAVLMPRRSNSIGSSSHSHIPREYVDSSNNINSNNATALNSSSINNVQRTEWHAMHEMRLQMDLHRRLSGWKADQMSTTSASDIGIGLGVESRDNGQRNGTLCSTYATSIPIRVETNHHQQLPIHHLHHHQRSQEQFLQMGSVVLPSYQSQYLEQQQQQQHNRMSHMQLQQPVDRSHQILQHQKFNNGESFVRNVGSNGSNSSINEYNQFYQQQQPADATTGVYAANNQNGNCSNNGESLNSSRQHQHQYQRQQWNEALSANNNHTISQSSVSSGLDSAGKQRSTVNSSAQFDCEILFNPCLETVFSSSSPHGNTLYSVQSIPVHNSSGEDVAVLKTIMSTTAGAVTDTGIGASMGTLYATMGDSTRHGSDHSLLSGMSSHTMFDGPDIGTMLMSGNTAQHPPRENDIFESNNSGMHHHLFGGIAGNGQSIANNNDSTTATYTYDDTGTAWDDGCGVEDFDDLFSFLVAGSD